MCTQGLSAPVWDQTQTDPLPCARGLGHLRVVLSLPYYVDFRNVDCSADEMSGNSYFIAFTG